MIRFAEEQDKEQWFLLDKYLDEALFADKIKKNQGFVFIDDATNKVLGILRYNLFRDSIPFCTLLYVDEECRGKGFGKSLLKAWERNMRIKGYNHVLISTQANEDAQNFYRHLGYKDSGSLLFDKQPTELFMYRTI